MKSEARSWMSSGALSRELAKVGVHLSAPTLQRYAREGRLPARKTPGGHYRFDLGEVVNTLEARTVTPPSASPIEDLLARHREEVRAAVARHHGVSVHVFGSVARGEAGPESDVDLLVDFAPESSLFDLLRLTDELEQILGRPVDVVAEGGLKPRDEHIRREAIALGEIPNLAESLRGGAGTSP
jgi:predicted nucleotidyltransferase